MTKLKPLKFTTHTRIIDHLGIAAYSRYTKAIKELIANGYDADATRVNVWFNKGEIIIADNGSGMDENDIRKEYMAIGSGHKRKVKRTPKFNRLPIGNKGIGKLAGFGISKVMEVETIKDRKKYFYKLDKDEIDKKEKLEDAIMDNFNDEDINEKPGTTIKLTNLLSHVKRITESESFIKKSSKKLREFLATSLPDDPHFEVYVNNKKCTKIDVPYKRRYNIPNSLNKLGIEIISLTTYDEKNKKRISPRGFIKIARKAVLNPGIITKVRGSAIGEPRIFDLNKGSHKFVHATLLTGEIEITEFDPENEKDEIPIIQTDREGFNEDHQKYIVYNKFMTEVLKKICRIEEKDYNKKRREEVQAKVKDAIKNIRDVFNDYHKEFVKTTSKPRTKLKLDKNGGEDVWSGEPKGKRRKKISNPIGIKDNSLKKKLKAIKGEGNIKLGDKNYKITLGPKGEDEFECLIEDSIKVIYINTDHPAYDLAVIKTSVELTVFRAIASAWAYKICKEKELNVEQMYEKIDELIRYHAEWTRNKRRDKKLEKPKKELKTQFEMSLSIENDLT